LEPVGLDDVLAAIPRVSAFALLRVCFEADVPTLERAWNNPVLAATLAVNDLIVEGVQLILCLLL